MTDRGKEKLKRWFKAVYHDIFRWHEPDETTVVETDSGNLYCRCRYCRRLMMRDSQGNWF